eukprot:7347310-Prymnesium_polylepis.1
MHISSARCAPHSRSSFFVSREFGSHASEQRLPSTRSASCCTTTFWSSSIQPSICTPPSSRTACPIAA